MPRRADAKRRGVRAPDGVATRRLTVIGAVPEGARPSQRARWEAGAFELGRRLATARERAGMSHEELALLSGVPVRYQQLIEEGRLDQLPDPTHARGYVRTFAAAVGLDQDAETLAYCRLRRRARFVDQRLMALFQELGR